MSLRTLRNNFRLFFEGALLSYVALFRWLRPMTYLASKVVSPLSYMLFFVFLGKYASNGSEASFYIVGNALQIAASSGIYGVTMSIGGDRRDGTLLYLFGSPANRLTVFFGRAFMHIIDGAFGVVLGFFWGVVLLGLDLSQANLGALALVIVITTFSTCGLGLLCGCLSLVTLNVMFVNNTVFFLLLLFSGANVQTALLPAWAQAIGQALPLTRGIAAARQIVGGASLAEVSHLLAGELLFGFVYVALGYLMFRWFEAFAKRRGTLEAF
ncbi:MAG: ABC transporter permease [Anaerolineales bacterium]|jgi:ABC-2 type transport system permease protein|nr:ABC transporter permease [Anaerolineales bacterium]MCW5838603.1 ABC transporter permease [Anaerolineales bacterium]MCW5888367.1 ABC transporter permease [Anaerolineales bacterium]